MSWSFCVLEAAILCKKYALLKIRVMKFTHKRFVWAISLQISIQKIAKFFFMYKYIEVETCPLKGPSTRRTANRAITTAWLVISPRPIVHFCGVLSVIHLEATIALHYITTGNIIHVGTCTSLQRRKLSSTTVSVCVCFKTLVRHSLWHLSRCQQLTSTASLMGRTTTMYCSRATFAARMPNFQSPWSQSKLVISL